MDQPAIIDSLRSAVRNVPDFPKPGIVFKDITPLLSDPIHYGHCMEQLALSAAGHRVDKVVGIDARGFIFAAAVADRLKSGFVPVRKKGKLPWHTRGVSYDLEYGSNHVEMHTDAISPGESVLLVDDVLATGGTAAAAIQLVQLAGGNLIGAAFLIELGFLNGREKLPPGTAVHSVLKY